MTQVLLKGLVLDLTKPLLVAPGLTIRSKDIATNKTVRRSFDVANWIAFCGTVLKEIQAILPKLSFLSCRDQRTIRHNLSSGVTQGA